MNLKQGCGTPGCTDPNCTYGKDEARWIGVEPLQDSRDWFYPSELRHTGDNRMVQCVLSGYTTCPARVPEGCICYQMQQTPVPKHGNLYEERYIAKYGKDEQ